MNIIDIANGERAKTLHAIIQRVKLEMLGRMADECNNTALMAEMTLCDGDHLEIGTLHGGSAIVVALLKRAYGYSGRVVCLDPFDGYYPKTKHYRSRDVLTNVPVSVETLRENMKRFDVELEIVQAYSIPFPISGRTFATAYIDGNHWGDAPLQDFQNVSQVTEKFIIFDNCGDRWPDVTAACDYAETVWQPYKRQGITCIVRHP